jgi:hypothetical protein
MTAVRVFRETVPQIRALPTKGLAGGADECRCANYTMSISSLPWQQSTHIVAVLGCDCKCCDVGVPLGGYTSTRLLLLPTLALIVECCAKRKLLLREHA